MERFPKAPLKDHVFAKTGTLSEARALSGYLDCAASEAGRASTHAWAEAYLPDRGWTGYDPTLGEATSRNHVVTGPGAGMKGAAVHIFNLARLKAPPAVIVPFPGFDSGLNVGGR